MNGPLIYGIRIYREKAEGAVIVVRNVKSALLSVNYMLHVISHVERFVLLH
jgi:hypothetical protein